jgi:hypothetical protein
MYQKDKKRILPLSEQLYASVRYKISVVKAQRKVQALMVTLLFTQDKQEVTEIYAELINKKRQTLSVSFKEVMKKAEELPPKDNPQQKHFNVEIQFEQFIELLEKAEFPFEALRIVTETKDGKKYKSHELALHNWWNIMKLDSGNYN